MSINSEDSALRKQEVKRISRRMKETEQEIDLLSDCLHAGIGEMQPSQWEELLAKYHAALRRYDADELYFNQLKSKAKLTDEERERTARKDYRRNYKY